MKRNVRAKKPDGYRTMIFIYPRVLINVHLPCLLTSEIRSLDQMIAIAGLITQILYKIFRLFDYYGTQKDRLVGGKNGS